MLPQFSLRTTLLLLTGAAALSAIAAQAWRGEAWAIGVTAAFAWAAIALLVHALIYVAAAGLGGLGRRPAAGRTKSPQRGRPEEAPVG